MDDKKPAEDLLNSYISNTATPEEIEQVEKWYHNADAKKPALSDQRKMAVKAEMLMHLKNHMGNEANRRHTLISRNSFLRIAATITLISGIAMAYWKIMPQAQMQHTASVPQVMISTKAGEKKTLRLSDGTKITMNELSSISYPKQFGPAKREVKLLEGEAFFDVAHEEKRTFTISLADKIYTRVLGTSFTVRALKASGELNIAVSTGKVAVGNPNQVFGTLEKGQQLTYNRKKQSALISQVPVADIRIVFDGLSLAAAIRKLEYIYSIKIELAPENLGKLACTATFHSKQTPDEILSLLCGLHNLHFSTTPDHKSFKIYSK